MLVQHVTSSDLYPQVACGLSNGKEALSSFSLSTPSITIPPSLLSLPHYSHTLPLATTATLTGIFSALAALTLLLSRQQQNRKDKTSLK